MNGFEKPHERVFGYTDAGQSWDGEEIVRCCDCESFHRWDVSAIYGNHEHDTFFCSRFVDGMRMEVEPLGFCKWGKARSEQWDMRSNHAVQAANEQKVDERNTVPETKYLMALDEAREASKDAERWERIARDRKSMCESLKETNADLRKIIKRIKEDK